MVLPSRHPATSEPGLRYHGSIVRRAPAARLARHGRSDQHGVHAYCRSGRVRHTPHRTSSRQRKPRRPRRHSPSSRYRRPRSARTFTCAVRVGSRRGYVTDGPLVVRSPRPPCRKHSAASDCPLAGFSRPTRAGQTHDDSAHDWKGALLGTGNWEPKRHLTRPRG